MLRTNPTNGVLAILPKLAAVLLMILGLQILTLRWLEVFGERSQRIDLWVLHTRILESEIRSRHLLDRPGSKSPRQERVQRAHTTLPLLGPALQVNLSAMVVGTMVAVEGTGMKRKTRTMIARMTMRKNRFPIIIVSLHRHKNRRHPRRLVGEAGARKPESFPR